MGDEGKFVNNFEVSEEHLKKECAELVSKLAGAVDYCEKQKLQATAERFLLFACKAAMVAGKEEVEIDRLIRRLLTVNLNKLIIEQEKEIKKGLTDGELEIVGGYREYERQYNQLDDQFDIFNRVSDIFLKSVIEKYSGNQ